MMRFEYWPELIKSLVVDTYNTALRLFKIMIPLSIAVKLLQSTGLIVYLGIALAPLMKMVGLPGEIGLVWASTMITNIYGGMLTFYSLDNIHLTEAQVTVMSTLMLVAHTLPVELRVAQQAGARLFTMFVIRFGFAFLAAFVLNAVYNLGGWLQEPAIMNKVIQGNAEGGWLEWLLNEVHRYAVITMYIFCLLALMRFLKFIGFINLLTNTLKPVLKVLGVGKEVIPITVIGSTLGILYGGALIIKETEEKGLDKMDVFFAMTLMGLCHSLIEDSILMLSLGASYTGVFIFRMLFAFIITFFIVRLVKTYPDFIKREWLVRP